MTVDVGTVVSYVGQYCHGRVNLTVNVGKMWSYTGQHSHGRIDSGRRLIWLGLKLLRFLSPFILLWILVSFNKEVLLYTHLILGLTVKTQSYSFNINNCCMESCSCDGLEV